MANKTNNTVLAVKPETCFGNWKVIEPADKIDYINCICICGTKKDINVYSLKSGKSKSCGCRTAQIANNTRRSRNAKV